MENNTIQISNFELLGRVLDGKANSKELKTVLFNMSDAVFEECFMVALRATTLFNEKYRLMKQFNKISDEELAAYLEGMLSDKESAMVDAAMDVDTLEILNVSRKALDEFPTDNIISLPSWENVAAASIRPMYEPLAMAGFLGDSNADETADEELEEDNE